MSKPPEIAILIMAAGASSRMGTSKQLLQWNNTTLIKLAIKKALAISNNKTYVVLGANYEVIYKHIRSHPIRVLRNLNWERGLGNSIAFGVQEIDKNGEVDGVLIMLADQPLISSVDLEKLISNFKVGKKKIVATRYENNSIGVPAIFDSFYFKQLTKLDDDKGAKAIIKKHSEKVAAVTINNKLVDIDTPEMYQKLLGKI